METQEIISEIEAAENVNDDILNGTIVYKLYEQQAKGFEEFGKQINLNLKNLFKQNIINLDKIETEYTNSNNYIDVDDVRRKFDEMLNSQSKEIESLNARIEELETDSIIKDQDLEKFKQEFDIFKNESRLSLKIEPAHTLTMMSENEYTAQTLVMNENEHNEKENFIGEGLAKISTSQQSNKSKGTNEKVDKQIRKFVKKKKSKKFKANTFHYLSEKFTIDELLEYERSHLFHLLDKNAKNSVNLSISGLLKEELTFKKRMLSQPIDVYINRSLVPSLPSGVKSYNEFQKTKEFDLLSKGMKIGIMKLILIE